MSKSIQTLKGIHDILPEQVNDWRYLEQTVAQILSQYGYSEIRLPCLEYTELFKRSIGEVTDIVEKEMYSFEDTGGKLASLRPEGTAGCVRAGIEHGLLYNQIQRLWYSGPMFRRERPQKDRYRQFYQIGAEVFGLKGPDVDAEMIMMTGRMWQQLGIQSHVKLQINSLGTATERKQYRDQLVVYLRQHESELDAESQSRLERNPLRVLDSKSPAIKQLLQQAPKLWDCLGEESQQHFQKLTAYLDQAGLSYEINPYLVRGLDYYCHVVFEWVTDLLGAQSTVCAGGRYDGLVEQLGGKPTPGIGFAMGIERLLHLLQICDCLPKPASNLHIYMIMVGELAEQAGFHLAETCRDAYPALGLQLHCGGGSFKSQFKKADKSGAKIALVLGDDEVEKGVIGVKPLREADLSQQTIPQSELINYLQQII